MPRSAKIPCREVGCRELLDKPGHCAKHKSEKAKILDTQRGSSTKRGYGYKWQQAREGYLKHHPWCVKCSSLTVANVVDHIVPHKGDKQLFWDKTNWQSLCKTHHDIKTATEDSNFARGKGGLKIK